MKVDDITKYQSEALNIPIEYCYTKGEKEKELKDLKLKEISKLNSLSKEELKKEESRPLFITTSEAVFKELESNCKDVVNALDIDKIKVHENECENKTEWQHHFYQYLMGAIQGDGNRKNQVQSATDKCSVSGQIKLHLFPGNGINKCFNMSDKHIPVCLIKLK